MTQRPIDILQVTSPPDFDDGVPTPDQVIPLLFIAGVAAADQQAPQAAVPGRICGSLSMTSYTVGAAVTADNVAEPITTLRAPGVDAPDQSNM
jgi:4,5-DOPA dioxygenase extradiol